VKTLITGEDTIEMNKQDLYSYKRVNDKIKSQNLYKSTLKSKKYLQNCFYCLGQMEFIVAKAKTHIKLQNQYNKGRNLSQSISLKTLRYNGSIL